MTLEIRPAVREDTPLIVGLAGPTKSGKTYSAHRLARGLTPGGKIIMINAEGKRGHMYADKFKYDKIDIYPPYTPAIYEEAVELAGKAKPDAVIIDSASHLHDGPGGLLEYHEAELDRLCGKDAPEWKRKKATWTAWIKPKAEENRFVYMMLALDCPIVLCFRAKEKLRIVTGEEPVKLGWQPIASDRVAFETMVTLVLPPHCKGVPDLDASELREPFDTLIPIGQPIDEELGRTMAQWATGMKRHVAKGPGDTVGGPREERGARPAEQTSAGASSQGARETEASRSSATGPDAPTYAPLDAIAMLQKMHDGVVKPSELERFFAPGVKNKTALEHFQKDNEGLYRSGFESLWKSFVAWRDQQP